MGSLYNGLVPSRKGDYKVKKSLILVFIVLLILSGCQSNNTVPNSQKQPNISMQNYNNEQSDIESRIKKTPLDFSKEPPTNYDLTATIDYHKDADGTELISYEIFIKNSKQNMENIILSFSLNPVMFNKLNTSHVFQSNAFNDAPIKVTTDGNYNGTSLGRGFILDKEKVDTEMLKIYKEVYLKISYTTNNEIKKEYYKLTALPSSQIQKYLNEAVRQ